MLLDSNLYLPVLPLRKLTSIKEFILFKNKEIGTGHEKLSRSTSPSISYTFML